MKQIPASILTLLAGILITLVSLWVGQNHGLMPEQASEQAPLVDQFFNVMVTIATALFLVVEGAILLFVIKYRRRSGDNTDGLPIEGSIPLEIFWTAIPAIIVIGLGAYSVEVYAEMGGFSQFEGTAMAHHHSSHSPSDDRSPIDRMMMASAVAAPEDGTSTEAEAQLAESTQRAEVPPPTYGIQSNPEEQGKPADLVVNVTAMQYAWIFNYPDSGITSGELHVPVGQDVQLKMTAQDVIHSFWIPQFRLKQDVMPGESSELRFTATKTGDYPIVCTELCGGYHGSMRSQIVVHSTDEFNHWLAQNRIAQQNTSSQTIATNSTDLSPSEFLAPYAQAVGVDANLLSQLRS